ncbi:MAG: ATP-binding protein [Bacteroidia bacterium]|nr:ATP-binding protein [Bacteroidia bacterium]
MKRYFNTTGYCNPEWHYIVEPLRGFKDEIYSLIQNKQYFLIHAPRQSGKTTLLHSLTKLLNSEGVNYSVVFSVERAGYKSITEEEANYRMCEAIYTMSGILLKENIRPAPPVQKSGISVYSYLNKWVESLDKPLVLLIDEVDSLYDDILISLLRQLRDGFQIRPEKFPCCIALVGLRDIREYKTKVRKLEDSLGSGSPFNIKAESFMLGSFTKEMVKGLYAQHTIDTNQDFSNEVIDLIYDYTGGQPWLVNAIANEITEKILKKDYTKQITTEIAEQAKENLILRRDTHLDSLIDKLKEERVKSIVTNIITGGPPLFDTFDDDLRYCIDLGIVINKNHKISFSNQIYKEIIPRVLNYHLQMGISEEGDPAWYIKDDKLDMDKLLKAFQVFYRENSEHWIDRFNYKEAGQQLLLMAFLQRVINANGRIEREMAVGRGRTDLVVHFGKDRYVLELKIKHKQYSKEKSYAQLSRYLDTLGSDKGYLILFEPASSVEITWETRIKWEEVQHNYENRIKYITVVEM